MCIRDRDWIDRTLRYELWVTRRDDWYRVTHETNLTSNSYRWLQQSVGNFRVWVRAIGSTGPAAWSQLVDCSVARSDVPSDVLNDSIPTLLASVFEDSQLLSTLERRVIEPVFIEDTPSERQDGSAAELSVASS